jgi:hypothetical protein
VVHRKNLGKIDKNRNKKSYSLFLLLLFFLSSSSSFFYKGERRDKRNDKNKQCNELFFVGTNFGHRHEYESVLDIAPIHKYSSGKAKPGFLSIR